MTSILLLDDDSDIRAVLRLRFEAVGWRVVEASNGHDAVKLAKEHPPNVLLLDWMTPGLTGIEVLTALRNHVPTSRIPTIMMTGRDEPTAESQARALGAIALLQKPVDLAQLVQTIRQSLA